MPGWISWAVSFAFVWVVLYPKKALLIVFWVSSLKSFSLAFLRTLLSCLSFINYSLYIYTLHQATDRILYGRIATGWLLREESMVIGVSIGEVNSWGSLK